MKLNNNQEVNKLMNNVNGIINKYLIIKLIINTIMLNLAYN
jgi:hypothetical protein